MQFELQVHFIDSEIVCQEVTGPIEAKRIIATFQRACERGDIEELPWFWLADYRGGQANRYDPEHGVVTL
jgi:hypothetical protein